MWLTSWDRLRRPCLSVRLVPTTWGEYTREEVIVCLKAFSGPSLSQFARCCPCAGRPDAYFVGGIRLGIIRVVWMLAVHVRWWFT